MGANKVPTQSPANKAAHSIPTAEVVRCFEDGLQCALTCQECSRTCSTPPVESLKAYWSENTKLIFFGPQGCKTNDPVVKYIPVEEVFDDVEANYPQLITRMLGL